MKNIKKTAILLAVVILFGVAVGGTLAWLTDEADPVVNTFTTSGIDITLTESASSTPDNDDNVNTNSYQMIPGHTIAKDPKVTVLADSEKCYLYVKLEGINDFSKYMTYEMAEGWTQLYKADETAVTDETEKVDGVFYRVVDKSATAQEFKVIKDDTVTVSDKVTKADMQALETAGANKYPQLKVTAYACQYFKDNTTPFGAYSAWQELTGQETTIIK